MTRWASPVSPTAWRAARMQKLSVASADELPGPQLFKQLLLGDDALAIRHE